MLRKRTVAAECPHLGSAMDPFTRDTHASEEHRCYARLVGERVDLSHQRRFCLSSTHGRCPFLDVSAMGNERQWHAQAGAWWRTVSPVHRAPTAAQLGQAAGLGAAAARQLVGGLAATTLDAWRSVRPSPTAGAPSMDLTRRSESEQEPMSADANEETAHVAEGEPTGSAPSPHALEHASVGQASASAQSHDFLVRETDYASASVHTGSMSPAPAAAEGVASAHNTAVSVQWFEASEQHDSDVGVAGTAASAGTGGGEGVGAVHDNAGADWCEASEQHDNPVAVAGTAAGADTVEGGGVASAHNATVQWARASEQHDGAAAEEADAREWFWRAKNAETIDELVACLERAHRLDPDNEMIASNLEWAMLRRDAARQAAKHRRKPAGTPESPNVATIWQRRSRPSLPLKLLGTALDLVRAAMAMAAFAMGGGLVLAALPPRFREDLSSALGVPWLLAQIGVEGIALPDTSRLTSLVHVPLADGYDLGLALPYALGFLAMSIGMGLLRREPSPGRPA